MEEMGRHTIESITEADWYEYADYLKVRYKENSRAYCINAIKPFFKYWNRRGLSDIYPDTIVTQQYQEQHRDTLDEDEYEALLEVIGSESVISCRDSLIVRILAETGVRVSELIELNIESLGTGQDCTAQIKTKKNTELGYIMWSKETNTILHKWLGYRLCIDKGIAVFTSLSPSSIGKRITTRSIERILAGYIPLVTEKKITPHSLRHSKAHRLLQRGATEEEFNLILRHKNWSSRFKYLRLSRKEFIGMAKKYLFTT